MAFCKQCGSPVEGSFCAKCGTKLDAPITPGAPPAQFPPPQAPPAASPVVIPSPAAPTKKGRFIFWALGGCLVLVIIFVIVVFSTCGYFAHKVGFDSNLLQKKPELAVAKMLVSANPDLEFVSMDEDRGIIRVREKKTGKELTVDLENAKNGKIVFSDEKNKRFEIKTQGEGENAGVEIKSSEGTMKMGANAAGQLPNWLPSYPGAESAGAMVLDTENGKAASCSFKSKDSVEAIGAYYETALKGAGFEVQKTTTPAANRGSMIILSASEHRTQRKANVTASSSEAGTIINLTFEGK
jgi:hypothetical protein